MSKKYFSFKDYKDISQLMKDIAYGCEWRKLPDCPKPEYINLHSGEMAYIDRRGRMRIRKLTKNSHGYLTTKLKQWDGSFKTVNVHCLIKKFIYNPEHKPLGHHKDHDKTNNSALNIEPATYKENANK